MFRMNFRLFIFTEGTSFVQIIFQNEKDKSNVNVNFLHYQNYFILLNFTMYERKYNVFKVCLKDPIFDRILDQF